MSNTYQLTQHLHELIQEKAKKHGLEIEIENIFRECEYFFYEIFDVEGTITQRLSSVYLYEPIGRRESPFKRLCPAIQTQQIRQILLAFREVLGGNPEKIDLTGLTGFESAFAIFKNGLIAKSYSKTLDDQWLGAGEDEHGNYQLPLIDREPQTVLSELLEILKSI